MDRLPDVILLILLFLTILGGCATQNHGRLESNPDVTRAFETHRIMPDHTYYYRGTFSRPFVIVGINKNFELNLKLWVEIDTQSEDFRTLINRISIQSTGRAGRPWGFKIFDHTNREIGMWYSTSRAVAIEVNENGQITKLSPITMATRGDQGM